MTFNFNPIIVINMKYETIKKQVARNVYTQVFQCGAGWNEILVDLIHFEKPIPPRQAIKDCANLAYDRIMNWDIRCIGKLRELFPDYFPKSLLKGDLILEYGENGWEVFKGSLN